jgi:hypothetical protein
MCHPLSPFLLISPSAMHVENKKTMCNVIGFDSGKMREKRFPCSKIN